MIHAIASIPRRIMLLFLVVIAIGLVVLLAVTSLVDLAPNVVRHERLNYLIYTPILIGLTLVGLYRLFRPVSDFGRALDLGSMPSQDLIDAARRVVFTAPVYLLGFFTANVFVLSLLSDVLGVLFVPDYAFSEHFPHTILVTVLAACGALIISVVSQHWMRPILLYAAPQTHNKGRRFTIRARLFSIILILTLIAVLLSGLYAYSQAVIAYRQQLGRQNLVDLERAVDAVPVDTPQDEVLDVVTDNLDQGVVYEVLILASSQGQILDQRTTGGGEVTFDGQTWSADPRNQVRQAKGSFVLVPLDGERARWVGLGYLIKPLRSRMVVNALTTASLFGVGMVILVAIISHYLAASVVLDLRLLTGRLLNIAHQERVNLSKPVPVVSLDEVGDLIMAYNALQQRIRLQQEQIESEQRQLFALQSLSYKIGHIRDLERLLSETAQDVERAFGYQHVCILLVDESRQELVAAAVNHQHPYLVGQRFGIDDESVVGYVAKTATPFLVDDVHICEFSQVSGTGSEMAVPLIVDDRVIGVLDVSSTREGMFDEGALRIVTALGNQIAIAIENARLIDEAVMDAYGLER